jgi:hypothetical protein
MKSSISMKSWKTTISLSALLFLVFALAVLSWSFIGVSMPSSLRSPASPANGSITYDAPSNTITVVGGPYNFTDIYNADVAGGWGVTHLQGIAQFKIDAKLVFGDGSTTTTFSATNVQILQTNVAVADDTIIVRIENAATFTLGSLENATAKTTQYGVSWMVDGQNTWYRLWFQADTGAVLNIYSSLFQYVNARSDTQGLFIKSASSTNRIWNTMLTGYILGLRDGAADHYNVYISEADYAVVNQGGTFQNIFLYKAGLVWWWSSSVTITNLFLRRSFYAYAFDHYSDMSQYLINPDVDSWTFHWRGYYGSPNYAKVYRQYTIDLHVIDKANNAIIGATVTLEDKNGNTVFSVTTNATGDIATQTVSRGYYSQATGDTLQEYGPHTLTITKEGYQTYTENFTLSQKTNWTIALQPLTDGGLIEHVGFVPVDPDLTSPSGTYRWLDVADQAYGIGYRNSYNYSQSAVEVAYCTEGNKLQGLLQASNLKPNFAYQLKLVGTPGTADNERIGLAGRWWQEEWTGTTWDNGQNLNDKGDGSSPNPNDQTYFSRRYIQDSSSPTGYHYRYTGYLVFDYFITDSNGAGTLQFETGSCYHVIWKTTQRSNATNDGPVKTVTFDPALSQPAYDTDYPSNTVSIFGEWERLPMRQVNLQPGEYNCQILLTEESFHGSGGTLAGNWAGAVTANIMFTIN